MDDSRTPVPQGLMQPTLRLGVPSVFLGIEVIVATLLKGLAGDYVILLALIPVHVLAILATKSDPYWSAIYLAAIKQPRRYFTRRA